MKIYKSINYSWFNFLFIALIIVAMILAYRPVLFNFFTADDFHFIYLFESAKQNPVILWESFMHAIGPYYRPVWFTVMFGQYLIFGLNAFYFRIVSIGIKLLSAALIVLLISQFKIDGENQLTKKGITFWAIASAGLFALYPLHSEPIDWVVCHVELLTNLFVLGSLCSYAYWRNSDKFQFQIFSCLSMLLGLLTKETAVIIPLLISLYEIVIHNANFIEKAKVSSENLKQVCWQLVLAFKPTAVHWLILVFYFLLRLIVVGSFIGTWNNAAFYNPDNAMILKGWQQSLRMILFPFCSSVFSQADPLRIVWILLIITLLILTILSLKADRKLIRVCVFLFFWFLICLLPVYKLLYITPELLNARYGYLSSVPLCAFLTLGLAANSYFARQVWLRNVLFGLVLCLSFFILRGNNLAWAEAGRLSNNIVSEIRRIHREADASARTYLVNVPFVFNGVAIEGMDSTQAINHAPFAEKDSYNCDWLKNSDQSLPLGLISRTIESGDTGARFFTWDTKVQRLHQVDANRLKLSREFAGKITSTAQLAGVGDRQMNLPVIYSTKPLVAGSNSFAISLEPFVECWPADIIAVDIEMKKNNAAKVCGLAQLDYTNDIKTDTMPLDRLMAPINPSLSKQTLFFLVRGIPVWAFGGHCRTLQINFPKKWVGHIERIYTSTIANCMPELKFRGAQYDKHIGQVELNAKQSRTTFDYDASKIAQGRGVAIEVIGLGEYFAEMNSPSSNCYSLVDKTFAGASGQIEVDRNSFPSAGSFKMRLRPIDKDGKQCGFCSDHFIVHVSN